MNQKQKLDNSAKISYRIILIKKKKRILLLPDGETEANLFSGKGKLKVEIVNGPLDLLINELDRRIEVYHNLVAKFLYDIDDMSKENADR